MIRTGKIKTAGEFLDELTKVVEASGRDVSIGFTIPYRDGLGLHWEYPQNVDFHEGYVDIHLTMPDHDDVKVKNPLGK